MNKKNVLPKGPQQAVVSPSLQQAGNMVVSLTKLWRDRMCCDVLLQVEGTCAWREAVGEVVNETHGVWAHSVVLAAVSPYFHDRCKSSNGSTTKVIFINYVKLETLPELVENIYTATALLVSVEKAKLELLVAATSPEVCEVRDTASDCLRRAPASVPSPTGTDVLSCLQPPHWTDIHDHFQRVLMADEFLTLDTDSLFALLDINRLAADNESVFDAVLRWMLHHPRDVNMKRLRKRVEDMYSVTSLVDSMEQAKELLAKATALNVGEVRDMACKRLQRRLST